MSGDLILQELRELRYKVEDGHDAAKRTLINLLCLAVLLLILWRVW